MTSDERPGTPMTPLDAMPCDRVRAALRARAADPDSAPAGADLLAHLASCAACRRDAIAADPALLFALAAAAADPARLAAPEPDWTGFNARVRAAIEDEARRGGIVARLLDFGLLAPGRLVPAVGLAAAVAVAILVGWRGWQGSRPGLSSPLPREAVLQVPHAPAATAGAALAPAALSAPPLESVASPTARVVYLRVGKGTESPGAAAGADAQPSDVVVILDEKMDL